MSPQHQRQRVVHVTVHYQQADGVVTGSHQGLTTRSGVSISLPPEAELPPTGQKVKLMWVTTIEEVPDPAPEPSIPERHLCIRCRDEPCNGPGGDFQRMLGPRCLRLEREEQMANRPRSR